MATSEITVVCSVCGRLKTTHGWIKINYSPTEPCSHSYCPECFRRAMTEVMHWHPSQHRHNA